MFKFLSKFHIALPPNSSGRLSQLIPDNLRPFSIYDVAFYAFIAAFSFIAFLSDDILETARQSLTYLDGHITDFYETNRVKFTHVHYPPFNYVLFAIWNIPIYYQGLTGSHLIFNMWQKFIIVPFFIGAIIYFYRISRLITGRHDISILMTAFWASTPLLFFEQFIFGQTYTIPLFFMLASLYYMFQRRLFLGTILIGVGVSFKYFPILIFIPILLLLEKRPLHVASWTLLSLLPLAIGIFYYYPSDVFRADVLEWGDIDRFFGYVISLHRVRIFERPLSFHFSVAMLLWFLVCAIAYLHIPKSPREMYQWSMYLSLVALSAFFILTAWHPYRFALLTPFLATTTFMHSKGRLFAMLDFVLMGAFVLIVMEFFPFYAFERLWRYGGLAWIQGHVYDTENAFIVGHYLPDVLPYAIALVSAILVANATLKYPWVESNTWATTFESEQLTEFWNAARVRFVGGVMCAIIPLILSFGISYVRGESLGTRLIYTDRHTLVDVPGGLQTAALTKGTEIRQVFKADFSAITNVTVLMGEFRRASDFRVQLRKAGEEDGERAFFTATISGRDVSPDKYLRIHVGRVAVTRDEMYELVIKPLPETEGSSVKFYVSSDHGPAQHLVVNGEPKPGSLIFSIYGER